MKNEELFPVVITPCSEYVDVYGGYTRQQWNSLSSLFHVHRQGRTWYAYKVIIHDKETVSFEVYGMLCAILGGVDTSKILWSVDRVAVTDPDHLEAIEMKIWGKALCLAKERRLVEIMRAEQHIIDGYAREIVEGINND